MFHSEHQAFHDQLAYEAHVKIPYDIYTLQPQHS